MYIKLYNKHKPQETMIVTEHSDYLFEEGWRIAQVLGNSVTMNEIYRADEDKRQASIRQYGF